MRKKIGMMCYVFIMCLIMTGIVNAEKPWPKSVDEYINNTGKQVKAVDMKTFKEIYDKKEFDLIVDIREVGEYKAGHIPEAYNAPRGVLEFMIWSKLGYPDTNESEIKNKKIYLYCRIGLRAILAAKALKDMDFKNVVAVTMDYEQW